MKIIYIKNKIAEHSITQITYKHINQYSADVFNSYKINKTHNVKKTYYNSDSDVFINKHNTINTNDTYNITKNNSLCNVTDKNYYTKKVNDTSKITNNITRHNHNNYDHNVIKKVHKLIKNIHNYDTEINCYNKKSHNKEQCYNSYHDNFNFRKIEHLTNTAN